MIAPPSWLCALGAMLAPVAARAQPAPASSPSPSPGDSARPPQASPAQAADAPASAWPQHSGLTLEAGLAVGMVRTPGPYSRLDSPFYGAGIGAGFWLSPRSALTARITYAAYRNVSGDDSNDDRHVFFGPGLQYWVTHWAWVSGGAGMTVYNRRVDVSPFQTSVGLGFDARAGLSVGPFGQGSPHTFNLSIEVNPAFYSNIGGMSRHFIVMTLVGGYQFL